MMERRQLGSYELDRCIGKGGMGEVWQARHLHLSRPAAVKLIRPNVMERGAGAELLERFKREASATSHLRSPHTVEVYDFGITEEGLFYYVMELLEGCTLQQMVDAGGPLPPARAVSLLTQACESLAEAHAAGLIHRDIKPGNLFVCQRVGSHHDYLKVLDFGLVKVDEDAGIDSPRLTHTNATQGTPAFMPPEVVYGTAHFDQRSDIYALGCVAYWLLAGRWVFEAPNPTALTQAHINDTPTPLSEAASQSIPSALEALVMQCLEKQPDDRPQRCEDIAEALAAVDAGRWTKEAAEAWWRDHPLAAPDPSQATLDLASIHPPETGQAPGDTRGETWSDEALPPRASQAGRLGALLAALLALGLVSAVAFWPSPAAVAPSCMWPATTAHFEEGACRLAVSEPGEGDVYALTADCDGAPIGHAVADGPVLRGLSADPSACVDGFARPVDDPTQLVTTLRGNVTSALHDEACTAAAGALSTLGLVDDDAASDLAARVAACGRPAPPAAPPPQRVCFFEDSDTLLPSGARCCERGDAAPRRVLRPFGCDRGYMCLRWGRQCSR